MYLEKNRAKTKNFNDYRQFLTKKEFDKIKSLAKTLKAKKIIHINSTYSGGGVAEILKSLIPLEQSLGIKSSWHCIKADTNFFNITKKFHDGLQGGKVIISHKQKEYYLSYNKKFAEKLEKLKPDLVVIHDPQPLAISKFYYNAPMILRMHPDLSTPDDKTLKFLFPFIKNYKAIIFTLPKYAPKVLNDGEIVKSRHQQNPKIYISQPAIDPLEEKNDFIKSSECKKILAKIGINPNNPLIAQISRFDIWKNPLGVIEAFYKAKKEIPNLQLILSGIIEAKDDPTAYEVLKDVKEYAKATKDIYIFSDLRQLKKLHISHANFIKILQNYCNPIMQMSIKEGFGMTVTEAMWRNKVVIGGNADGIKFQIKDGVNGYLINTSKEAAKKIIKIIKSPELTKKLGINARKTVRKNLLITKLLADHLKIYREILGGDFCHSDRAGCLKSFLKI